MTLAADEFLRRFLIHILPHGFHRIRHFGLLANHQRKRNLQIIRDLLEVVVEEPALTPQSTTQTPAFVCRTCGTPLIIIQIIDRPQRSRAPP